MAGILVVGKEIWLDKSVGETLGLTEPETVGERVGSAEGYKGDDRD